MCPPPESSGSAPAWTRRPATRGAPKGAASAARLAAELRQQHLRGRLAEDAALLALRLPSLRWVGDLAHAVLNRIHRDALRTLHALPRAEAARAPRRLGLPSTATFVTAYDPAWAELYAAEAEAIRACLGRRCAEVDHIGSTAVPGLSAKPIIDIGVGLGPPAFDANPARAITRLEAIGYRYLGDRGGRGGHYFEKGPFPIRTHAIQLHPAGGPELDRLRRFRDALRRDSALAAEYAAIKQALAAVAGGNRHLYMWYKGHWVNGHLLEGRDNRAWSDWLLAHESSLLRRPRLRRGPWPPRRNP